MSTRTALTVEDFSLSRTETAARVSCAVTGGRFPDRLFYETSSANVDRLTADRANWAATSLLYPAMLLGQDIHIRHPVSPLLLHNLNNDIQAFLKIYDPRLKNIEITAPEADALDGARAGLNATGFSAGVDSFSTLKKFFYDPIAAPLKISALSLFDVGAFRSRRRQVLYAKALRRCVEFAGKHRLVVLDLQSNIGDFYKHPQLPKTSFEKTNTFRNLSAALVFEKSLSNYLISSSFSPGQIAAKASYNIAYLDPIILPLFCTEGLRFTSSCAGLSRMEKTALIADVEDARELLDVCVSDEGLESRYLNCSRCLKCVRTMITLDHLGQLDAFDRVFDVQEFRRNKEAHVLEIMDSAAKGNTLDAEVAMAIGRQPTRLPAPSFFTRLSRRLTGSRRR